MALTAADLSFEIDANLGSNLKLNHANHYAVTEWAETWGLRWMTAVAARAHGARSWGGYKRIRQISLQIAIETHVPSEYAAAVDALEQYLAGSASTGGGYVQHEFNLYKYKGDGGQRYLKECRCLSKGETARDGKWYAGGAWSRMQVIIEADDPDWHVSGAEEEDYTIVDNGIIIECLAGQVPFSVYRTDTGLFVVKMTADGDLYLRGGVTTDDFNITVP